MRPEPRQDATLEEEKIFTVTTLHGKRDDAMLELCARHMIQCVSELGCERCVLVLFWDRPACQVVVCFVPCLIRPLLLALGFKNLTPATIKEIVDVVLEFGSLLHG